VESKGEKHEIRKVKDTEVEEDGNSQKYIGGKVRPEKQGFCGISVYFLSFFVDVVYLPRPNKHVGKTSVERPSYW
jgi:hypothetical protein